MNFFQGGVTSPKGFKAAGIHCGIRKNTSKKDLALILADVECTAAAVYTTNKVQASPIGITKKHLANGKARAILANSGNANACAPGGEENTVRSCEALSKAAGIGADEIIINSTGVIGQRLPVEAIEKGMPELVSLLSETESGGESAAYAIMTTDTVCKQTAVKISVGGKTVTVGAMAKGSGMIHPNMATMLCFITTDCAVSPDILQKALSRATALSFNRVSVDGDTSTNDMTAILASGLAGNETVTAENENFKIFAEALDAVCLQMAKMVARDGEGATKFLITRIVGAKDVDSAMKLSMSVNKSSLVKTAMTGADANWGRVLCALGYAGADFNPESVDVSFASGNDAITVCRDGRGLDFDEDRAKQILLRDEILILCDMKAGDGEAEAYGCDLTTDYVKINGDYRT